MISNLPRRASPLPNESHSLAGRANRLVWLVALAIIPMLVAAVMIQWSSDRGRTKTQDARLARIAGSQHVELQSYFDEARKFNLLGSKNASYRSLYAAAGDRPPMELVRAGAPVVREVNLALMAFSDLYPNAIGEACIIGRDGIELARVNNGEIAPISELSPDESGAPHFNATFKLPAGEVNQTQPYWSPDMSQWVIANSTLLPMRGNRSPAYVHFEVTMASFLARARAQSDGQHIQIVDRATGRILLDTARKIDETNEESIGVASQSYRKFFASSPASGVADLGADRASWYRLEDASAGNRNDWVVVASSSPVATGLGHPSLGALLLLLAAAGMGGVVWIVRRSSREVVGRIERMAIIAEHSALDSSSDAVACDGRDDEISRLGSAFDSVVDAIRSATTTARRIAAGSVDVNAAQRDENDDLNKSFADTVEYIQSMATAASRIARGDIETRIVPRGDDDVLAHAFVEMTAYLRCRIEDADRIAGNDLSARPVPVSDHDRLGRALGSMVDNLRGSMQQTSAAARELSRSAEQLAATSGEVEGGMRSVSTSLAVISGGARRQIELVDATGVEISDAHSIVGVARERILGARDSAESASAAMRELATVSGSVTHAIRDLSSRSERIGEIVGTITGIAEQTNLLALNAAIEAARAGEQGRGFAVVADEVRKLAEESRGAAELIAGIIGQIRDETNRTVDVVQDANERTEGGVQLVATTTGALGEIAASIEEIAERIDHMQSAFEQVSTVAREGADSVQTVSAASSQTVASMEAVASAAQSLGEVSELLVESASRYRLEGAAPEGADLVQARSAA